MNKDIVWGFGIVKNSASRPNFGCFLKGFVLILKGPEILAI